MRSWTWLSSHSCRIALLLAAFAAAGLLALPGAASAQARYGRVVIDTSPIAESGAGQFAENIRPMLIPGVSRALAGLVDPRDRRAPTVVVTIKSLTLSMYGGAEDRSSRLGFGGGSSTDYLDAVVTIQSGPRVLSQFPLLVTQPASAGGSWFLPNQENRRVVLLGEALGYWLRRKLEAN
jgi:hypothetical protein